MPLGTEVGLRPGDIVLDGDTAPPPRKRAQPPLFRPMSMVAKRSPISATSVFFSNSSAANRFYVSGDSLVDLSRLQRTAVN